MAVTFTDWQHGVYGSGEAFTIDWTSPDTLRHMPLLPGYEALRQAWNERAYGPWNAFGDVVAVPAPHEPTLASAPVTTLFEQIDFVGYSVNRIYMPALYVRTDKRVNLSGYTLTGLDTGVVVRSTDICWQQMTDLSGQLGFAYPAYPRAAKKLFSAEYAWQVYKMLHELVWYCYNTSSVVVPAGKTALVDVYSGTSTAFPKTVTLVESNATASPGTFSRPAVPGCMLIVKFNVPGGFIFQ